VSELAKKYAQKAQQVAKGGPMPDRPKERKLNGNQQRALATIQKLAKEKGAVLASGGRGGLDPGLSLHIFRRDDFACTHPDHLGQEFRGEKGNALTLHHLGGTPGKSEWLNEAGHENKPENIATVCEEHHNQIHEEARAAGEDSSQVLAKGDKGDPRRDHGQPVAKPKVKGFRAAGTAGAINGP
jgi:hypothetical protein